MRTSPPRQLCSVLASFHVVVATFCLLQPLVAGQALVGRAEVVDDCCCELGTLAQVNHDHLRPILSELVAHTFFNYFKLNLYQECPFWVQEVLCGLQGGCDVCECDENDIPLPWKVQTTDAVSSLRSPQFAQRWEDDDTLEEFRREKRDLDRLPWIWSDPLEEEYMSYVNLADNPETNTGYTDGASSVWKAIYEENCFAPTASNNSSSLDGLCFEERVFYRLISGLHASISVHISEFYEKDESGGWKRNETEFWQRVGNHPDRVRNLYFTYLFLLRAAYRASYFLENYNYNTGNARKDNQVKHLMRRFLHNELRCEPTFDERQLFDEEEREGSSDELHARLMEKLQLKRQFKIHFRNISRIMDCVACEKCKIHGKLQVLGIGTALKILLEDRTCETLQRNEIIALVNTLYKFATSVEVTARYLAIVEDDPSAMKGSTLWHRAMVFFDDAPKDMLYGLCLLSLISLMSAIRFIAWCATRRPQAPLRNDTEKKDN